MSAPRWRWAWPGLAALLALAGCQSVLSPPPWAPPHAASNRYAHVETDVSAAAAVAAAALVERFAAAWLADGWPAPVANAPPVTVRLYARADQWRAALPTFAQVPAFGCTDLAAGTIHLLHDADDPAGDRRRLLHEASHWWLHLVGDSPPGAGPGQRWTRRVPLWLDEGVATCWENAVSDAGDALQPGGVNRLRARDALRLLGKGRFPPLSALLAARGHFGVEGYAAAWGLVYDLWYAPEPATRNRHRAAVRRLLAAPGATPPPFLATDESLADFERAWHARLLALPGVER